MRLNCGILSDKNLSDDDSVIMKSSSTQVSSVKTLEEKYPTSIIKTRFSGGISNDRRFLLDGKEQWYYENGNLKYEAVIFSILNEDPKSIRELREDTPSQLIRIVEKTL